MFGKRKENIERKRILDDILKDFSKRLKDHTYHGDYFDRSAASDSRLCDQEGWFQCQGIYNQDMCYYSDHLINPYGSKEDLIIFSTWDLDHR